MRQDHQGYLPERLNREPTVIRGLTEIELLYMILLGAAIGLIIGLVLWVVLAEVLLIPLMIPLGLAAAVFLGSRRLAALKRGKPHAWFYRHLEWVKNARGLSRNRQLLNQDAVWWLRRDRVRRRWRRTRHDRY